MNELEINVQSLGGGSMGSVVSDLDGGNLSSKSVNLDGGKINDEVEITLSGGKLDTQSKDIRGKPLQFGIAHLAIRAGKNGKSAYEYAKEYGYIGTEEEFGELLANIQSADVVDSLESEDKHKALSANQGRILNEKIDNATSPKWYDLDL